MASTTSSACPANAVLSRLLEEAADDVRVRRAEEHVPVLRRYAEIRYGAKSWGCKRRVSARIEATTLGLDIRCVVTNLRAGSAEWLYDTLYCARGQAENLIKLHKSQLASDRTSCRSALANQVRLVLHTAAYWLMLTVRRRHPQTPTARHSRVRHLAHAADQDRRTASPKLPHGSASRSPRLAPKPSCSAASHAACNQPGHNGRGCRPVPSRPTNPSAYKIRNGYCAPGRRKLAASSHQNTGRPEWR